MSDDLNKDLKNIPFATRESLGLTMPTPTPRSDAELKTFTLNLGGIPTTLDGEWVPIAIARDLERALSAAEGRVNELNAIIGAQLTALTAAQADLAACKRSLLQEETEHNATRAALEAARGE